MSRSHFKGHQPYSSSSSLLPTSATTRGRPAAVILAFCVFAIFLLRELQTSTRLVTYSCLPGFSASLPEPTQALFSTPTKEGKFHYLPCRISDSLHRPENITRFQFTPVTSWNCRYEVSDQYSLFFVDFPIKECPPEYASSTFQLEGSTQNSRVMGHISDRYTFHGGCGIYNASVAIMDLPLAPGETTKTVTLELYWTSQFRKYSNRIKDIQEAHKIKIEELATEQIQAMFTPERLEYLQRHLHTLFQRQLQITVSQLPLKPPSTPNSLSPSLPDCGTIPMDQWEPVGVFQDLSYNDTSPWQFPKDSERWPFRSARCIFPARTRTQLNDLLAGIRTFLVADSHGDNINNEIRHILCPELADVNREQYHVAKYDCPYRNNSFSIAYRFFRGVYQADMKSDMDAISRNLRHGSPKACKQILGLGLYNVTIFPIPHWLFVYETQEGLDDFLLALKSLVLNCRVSYPEWMKDHVFLVQSPTARDYLPFVKESTLDLHPAHSWRGIHNHRLDALTQKLKATLEGLVDGIIPAFEMTLARMKTKNTRDGVHLPFDDYRELLHVQVAAIRSAMKYKRGLDLPLMKADDPKARWFADQPYEWPLNVE